MRSFEDILKELSDAHRKEIAALQLQLAELEGDGWGEWIEWAPCHPKDVPIIHEDVPVNIRYSDGTVSRSIRVGAVNWHCGSIAAYQVLEDDTIDADGWIRWLPELAGGSPLLSRHTPIDVKLCNGSVIYDTRGYRCSWNHIGDPTDIVAYRLRKGV